MLGWLGKQAAATKAAAAAAPVPSKAAVAATAPLKRAADQDADAFNESDEDDAAAQGTEGVLTYVYCVTLCFKLRMACCTYSPHPPIHYSQRRHSQEAQERKIHPTVQTHPHTRSGSESGSGGTCERAEPGEGEHQRLGHFQRQQGQGQGQHLRHSGIGFSSKV